MRYRQLLLEYVREKTIERFHEAIFARMRHDDSASSVWTPFLSMYRSDKINIPLKEWVSREAVKVFLLYCEEADPTPTNSYVLWIVQRYISKGIQRFEDIRSTCAELLEQYQDIKQSGFFRRTQDADMKKAADINTIPSLFFLRALINSISPEERMSNTAADKALGKRLIKSGEAEVLVDTPNCLVVIPHTEEAAVFFGRNTQWCTSAKRHNAFEQYNKDGPLFIVLDKKNNRRWQFHPSTAQFMDENDLEMDRLDWDTLPNEAKEIEHHYWMAVKRASSSALRRLLDSDFRPFNRMAALRLDQMDDGNRMDRFN